eukprot:scaffold50892_cov81-Phaeocystis_antarctica.AAC.2
MQTCTVSTCNGSCSVKLALNGSDVILRMLTTRWLRMIDIAMPLREHISVSTGCLGCSGLPWVARHIRDARQSVSV